MKQIMIIVILSFLFMGCTNDTPKTNDEVLIEKKVKLLFEYEGVKVYKFSDNGRDVYFTNTSGKIEYSRMNQSGGALSTKHVQTLCN